MLDRLPHRLRESAKSTARASQMLADDKSARNRAAGDVGACYEGVKAEQTCEWQAADLIEKLVAALKPFAESVTVSEDGKSYTVPTDRRRPPVTDVIRARRVYDEAMRAYG